MRKKLVIIGSGIGGSILAESLADSFDITLVDCGTSNNYFSNRILDLGFESVTSPIVGSGWGGTTNFWHNGLIEIDAGIFSKKWPFSKNEIDLYYHRAYEKLSSAKLHEVREASNNLAKKYEALGVKKDLLGRVIFYPRTRRNVFKFLNLKKKINLSPGVVTKLNIGKNKNFVSASILTDGVEKELFGDVFVLAAGGLMTPVLLQGVEGCTLSSQLGLHYEDHPSAFVAELKLKKSFSHLWNFYVSRLSGNLRQVFVVNIDGIEVSFQLRPSFKRSEKIKSVLSDLRNRPFALKNYFSLIRNYDDIFDILSFKFGISFRTLNYSLLMVAQQSDDGSKIVSVIGSNNFKIERHWKLTPEYIEVLDLAVKKVIKDLQPLINDVKVIENWHENIVSSAHHSGTARLSGHPKDGVCDSDGKVWGCGNLFVCDGSLIPASGFANTGLTIAALALRLADHLCGKKSHKNI